MIKRGGAQFDLPALRGLAISGKDQFHELELLGLQHGLVIFGKILAPAGQAAYRFIVLQPEFVHPGKLREQLQVSPIAGGEGDQRLRAAGGLRPFVQFNEARPARHQPLMIHLKRAGQNLRFVLARKFRGVLESQGKPRLVKLSAGVLFELASQRRYDVERGVKIRELFEYLDHAPVVFQGMQSGPW